MLATRDLAMCYVWHVALWFVACGMMLMLLACGCG